MLSLKNIYHTFPRWTQQLWIPLHQGECGPLAFSQAFYQSTCRVKSALDLTQIEPGCYSWVRPFREVCLIWALCLFVLTSVQIVPPNECLISNRFKKDYFCHNLRWMSMCHEFLCHRIIFEENFNGSTIRFDFRTNLWCVINFLGFETLILNEFN